MRRKTAWYLLVGLLLLLAIAPAVSAESGGGSAIIAQDFVLEAGERHEEDLVVLGGSVRLEQDSVVKGDVFLLSGEAQLSGTVEGDVVAFGGSVELTSTSLTEGNVVVFGRVRRHPDARIGGSVVEGLEATGGLARLPRLFGQQINPPEPIEVPDPPIAPKAPNPPVRRSGWLGRVIGAIATLCVILFVSGLVAILVPDNMERMVDVLTISPLLCFGVGALTLVLAAVLVPLLTIICIGIPVAVVLMLALLFSSLVGWVAAGKTIGKRLYQMLNRRPQSVLVETLAGTLIITSLSLIQCVGPAFALFMACFGIGTVVLSRLGTESYPFWGGALLATTGPAGRGPVAIPGGSRAGVRTAQKDTKPLDEESLPPDIEQGATT